MPRDDASLPSRPAAARSTGRPTTSIFGYELVPLTRDLLRDSHLLRAAAGVTIGLVILFWPSRTDSVLAALVGVAFVVISMIAIVEAFRGHRPRHHIFPALLGLVVGAALVADVQARAGEPR